MTDREMLELAAKAAGIELWHEDVFTNGLTQQVSNNGILCWNPLARDGDALRLAVKLGMTVNVRSNRTVCDYISTQFHGDDPCAATRRAIVRTAAEIGKQMQSGD